MGNYRNLLVWQRSIELVVEVYSLTALFPKSEQFGLSSQMRRAAVSIPSNIAEGSRRSSNKDFRHFLINSFSSGSELETQIVIAKKLYSGKEFVHDGVDRLLDEVMRMLNKMINGTREED